MMFTVVLLEHVT